MLDENERSILEQFSQSEFGRVHLKWVEEELLADVEEQIESSPCIDDKNFKRDIRFKLGERFALKRVLKGPEK